LLKLSNGNTATAWRSPEIDRLGRPESTQLAHPTFTDLDSLDTAIHHAVADLNAARNRDPLDRPRISA
jgi:hypothetical protein